MDIKKINTKTLSKPKTDNKSMRIHKNGRITISKGLATSKKLNAGDRIEFLQSGRTLGNEWIPEKYFFSKTESEDSFELKKYSSGLVINNIELTKKLLEFFGSNENEKSIKVSVSPEPYDFKDKAFIGYEIKKK